MAEPTDFRKTLIDLLVSHNGEAGFSNNICDAVFAIAGAIDRHAEASQCIADALARHTDAIEQIAGALSEIGSELRGVGQEIGCGGSKSLGNAVQDLTETLAEKQ